MCVIQRAPPGVSPQIPSRVGACYTTRAVSQYHMVERRGHLSPLLSTVASAEPCWCLPVSRLEGLRSNSALPFAGDVAASHAAKSLRTLSDLNCINRAQAESGLGKFGKVPYVQHQTIWHGTRHIMVGFHVTRGLMCRHMATHVDAEPWVLTGEAPSEQGKTTHRYIKLIRFSQMHIRSTKGRCQICYMHGCISTHNTVTFVLRNCCLTHTIRNMECCQEEDDDDYIIDT